MTWKQKQSGLEEDVAGGLAAAVAAAARHSARSVNKRRNTF